MKKKILFVINTLGRAGAETALMALLGRLNPDEFDISLYVLCNQGEMRTELPSHVHLLNKNYCDSPVLTSGGKKALALNILKKCFHHNALIKNIPYLIKNIFLNIKNKRKVPFEKLLWKIVSDGSDYFSENYDLAVAYLEGGSAYYVAQHVNAHKKAAFIHVDYKKAGYTRDLDLSCYTQFDRVFTVSDEVKTAFLAVYPECSRNTRVFHNFIDKEKIYKKAEGKITESLSTGIRLLTVGRLTPQKGYDYAIKALKLLVKKNYPVYWYVIGDGPEYQTLLKQVKEEGLSERFIFLGAKENPYPYYKAADIYVHATRFEGKSIAIQEAQILSLPIVASDCSGNREQIISGIDGLLCPYTPEGIAENIEKLINDSELAAKFAYNASGKKINHIQDLQYIYELLN